LEAEGPGFTRRWGSEHVEEGHEDGFGLFSGFQCAGGFRVEWKREKDKVQHGEAGAEKARENRRWKWCRIVLLVHVLSL